MDNWRKANPDKDLAAQLRRFDITVEQFRELKARQNGLCAICHEPPNKDKWHGRLCVDHNHKNNKIRGLLCNDCNRALGMLGDSIEAFEKIISYLKGN